jgi:hypothetical protein
MEAICERVVLLLGGKVAAEGTQRDAPRAYIDSVHNGH